jgi:hypothetical protein
MFWHSFKAGLELFANWQTYTVTIVFLIFAVIPTRVIEWILSNRPMREIDWSKVILGHPNRDLNWWLTKLIPLANTFAVVVFILILSPLLLGFSNNPAWSLPWLLLKSEPWLLLVFFTKLISALIILQIIPIINNMRLISHSLVGMTTVVFLIELIKPESNIIETRPSVSFIVGLISIGFVLTYAMIFSTAKLLTGIGENYGIRYENLANIFMFPIYTLYIFFPTFIYARWIGMQLH